VRDWIIPPDFDHVSAEATHLINEADVDKVSNHRNNRYVAYEPLQSPGLIFYKMSNHRNNRYVAYEPLQSPGLIFYKMSNHSNNNYVAYK
jgi:TATA-box binding protein (TBP) (component of TFIID and TFIIIB)